MKNLYILFAFFLTLSIALAKRLTYLDLPTAQTTNVWYSGKTVRFPICWGNWYKFPQDMNNAEWKLMLKKKFGFSEELAEVTFIPFEDDIKNMPESQKKYFNSDKWKKLQNKKYGKAKCWTAKVRLPEDLQSSEKYYFELIRIRGGIWDRHYSKSPKFAIENTRN